VVSVEFIIYPIITIFSIALCVLAYYAYQKNSNYKMLGLILFFTLFTIKGIVISLNLFIKFTDLNWTFMLGGILDAFALFVLYIMTLKV
jgi:hypothetical protein